MKTYIQPAITLTVVMLTPILAGSEPEGEELVDDFGAKNFYNSESPDNLPHVSLWDD